MTLFSYQQEFSDKSFKNVMPTSSLWETARGCYLTATFLPATI